MATVQCTIFANDSDGGTVSRFMVKYSQQIPKESIVDVVGVAAAPANPVEGCTQFDVEITVSDIHVISRYIPITWLLDAVDVCFWSLRLAIQSTVSHIASLPHRHRVLYVVHRTIHGSKMLRSCLRAAIGLHLQDPDHSSKSHDTLTGHHPCHSRWSMQLGRLLPSLRLPNAERYLEQSIKTFV